MDKIATIPARELIAAAKLAAAGKDASASLKNVHVEARGGLLRVEATDGFKLARYSHDLVRAGGLDADACFRADEVRKAFRAGDSVALGFEGGALLLASKNARVAAREGARYPNCSQIVDAPVKIEGRGLAAFDAGYMAALCQAFEASEAARGGAQLAMLADGVRPIRLSASKGGDAFEAVLMPLRPGKGEDEPFPLSWTDAAKAADGRNAWARLPEDEKRRAMREERRRVAEEAAETAPQAPTTATVAPIEPKPEPVPEPQETAPQSAAESPKACMAETAAESPKECAAEAPEKAPKERAAAAPGKIAAEALAKSLGLAIRETSLCLWASGDTKPHAAELKGAGFKWSAKKSAWYWRKEVAA